MIWSLYYLVSFDRVANMFVSAQPEAVSIEMTSQDKEISMSMELLTSYLLDGQLTNDGTSSPFELPVADVAAVPFRITFPVGICKGNIAHFSNFWYDPTFTALFSGNPSNPDQQEETPAQKKNNKTMAIAVGVSLGTAGAIIAVLIVLVIKVPTVKAVFRPFVNRSNASNGKPSQGVENSGGEKKSSSWARASKPLP
jgi:hypothetical protein